MKELNNRIAKLQRLGKKRALKKLGHKRRNLALDFRRKLAAELSRQFSNAVIIGLPKNIRNEQGIWKQKTKKNQSMGFPRVC